MLNSNLKNVVLIELICPILSNPLTRYKMRANMQMR